MRFGVPSKLTRSSVGASPSTVNTNVFMSLRGARFLRARLQCCVRSIADSSSCRSATEIHSAGHTFGLRVSEWFGRRNASHGATSPTFLLRAAWNETFWRALSVSRGVRGRQSFLEIDSVPIDHIATAHWGQRRFSRPDTPAHAGGSPKITPLTLLARQDVLLSASKSIIMPTELTSPSRPPMVGSSDPRARDRHGRDRRQPHLLPRNRPARQTSPTAELTPPRT